MTDATTLESATSEVDGDQYSSQQEHDDASNDPHCHPTFESATRSDKYQRDDHDPDEDTGVAGPPGKTAARGGPVAVR
jgi:hypothetical protein